MPEVLFSIGVMLCGLAVTLSLIYIALQLSTISKQQRADLQQQNMAIRIRAWSDTLDIETLQSAKEKIFDEELYRRDSRIYELEELSRIEQVSLLQELQIELAYFSTLFHQRTLGLTAPELSKNLDYMLVLRGAPQRREWKDYFRVTDHFSAAFIRHVDGIVKQYDEVERRMEIDEDADYNAVLQEVFNMPAPPNWLES